MMMDAIKIIMTNSNNPALPAGKTEPLKFSLSSAFVPLMTGIRWFLLACALGVILYGVIIATKTSSDVDSIDSGTKIIKASLAVVVIYYVAVASVNLAFQYGWKRILVTGILLVAFGYLMLILPYKITNAVNLGFYFDNLKVTEIEQKMLGEYHSIYVSSLLILLLCALLALITFII